MIYVLCSSGHVDHYERMCQIDDLCRRCDAKILSVTISYAHYLDLYEAYANASQ